MWYLIAAIIGSSSLVILLKTFDLKGVSLALGITVNYVVGALLAFAFAPMQLTVSQIVAAPWFLMSVVIGILFSISFFVYALSAQRSGVAITTISGRAAVVLPVTFAFIFLGSEATVMKIAMLVLILFAMYLILKKDKTGDTGTMDKGWVLLLPLAVFLFNGTNDTLVQYAQKTMLPDADLIPVFTGTMFIAGAVTGLIFWIVELNKSRRAPQGKDLLWGSFLGFMNWVCMIGVFYALRVIDGSIFYPLYYTGAIILSTIFGVFVFKEKLSKINYVGIAIAIIAIAVLSTQ